MIVRLLHLKKNIFQLSCRAGKEKKGNFFLILILLLGLIEPFFLPSKAHATATTAYLRTDRMGSTVATGGTVCMTPQTTGTEGKVLVTFPGTGTQSSTSYGVNSTFGNWTVNTTNIPTGSTAWVGIGTATAVSGATVTFASGDLVVNTQYCFNFVSTSTLTLPTSANTNNTGTIETETSGGSAIDTVNYATSNIASNGDQITVTATVPSTFSMNLGGATTAALGSLPTSGAPATAAVTMTVSTNANNGWIAWAKNANANSTLTSATTADTSISSGAYSSGSNTHNLTGAAGYGLAVTTGSGSPTIAADYNVSTPSVGSLDSTKFEQIASKNVPANANTVTLTFAAEALPTTKAATDYTDTVTFTAAGQF